VWGNAVECCRGAQQCWEGGGRERRGGSVRAACGPRGRFRTDLIARGLGTSAQRPAEGLRGSLPTRLEGSFGSFTDRAEPSSKRHAHPGCQASVYGTGPGTQAPGGLTPQLRDWGSDSGAAGGFSCLSGQSPLERGPRGGSRTGFPLGEAPHGPRASLARPSARGSRGPTRSTPPVGADSLRRRRGWGG
jgi:hypothetical protein